MIERRSERGKNLILTWSRYTNFQSKMKHYRETWPLKKNTTHTHKKKLIQNRHSPQFFSSHIWFIFFPSPYAYGKASFS